MSERIILTFATGKPVYTAMAKALAISLQIDSSLTPRVLVSDKDDDPEVWSLFSQVTAPHPDFPHWFTKLSALEVTQAKKILFVDGDCLAIRNPDPIFDELNGKCFVVQGRWETDLRNWYGDIQSVMKRLNVERIPKFSGGFMYYERSPETKVLIDKIQELRADYDKLGLERNGGQVVDEVCISLAMAITGFGEVVPDACNYSITPWRAVSPVTLDVIGGRCEFVRSMPELELAMPVFYHSAMAKWDQQYWREARTLLRYFRTKEPPATKSGVISTITRKWNRLICEYYSRTTR